MSSMDRPRAAISARTILFSSGAIIRADATLPAARSRTAQSVMMVRHKRELMILCYINFRAMKLCFRPCDNSRRYRLSGTSRFCDKTCPGCGAAITALVGHRIQIPGAGPSLSGLESGERGYHASTGIGRRTTGPRPHRMTNPSASDEMARGLASSGGAHRITTGCPWVRARGKDAFVRPFGLQYQALRHDAPDRSTVEDTEVPPAGFAPFPWFSGRPRSLI